MIKLVIPGLPPCVKKGQKFVGSIEISGLIKFSIGEEEPEGPLDVTNVEKLSLDPATAAGTQVAVSDGFYVNGAVDPVANGFYFPHGTFHDNTRYIKQLPFLDDTSDYRFEKGGDTWVLIPGTNTAEASVTAGNEDFPWLANWSGTSVVLTHPALQQLAAPSSAQGGVFVAGGTQDGVYRRRPDIDDPEHEAVFKFVSVLTAGNEDAVIYRSINHSEFLRWQFTEATSGMPLYYSLSDVATPDLATDWKNASDDTPASITVTSLSQGNLVAGLKAGTDIYVANGSENGRNKYSDVLGLADDITFNGTIWSQGVLPVSTGNVAFPWNASWIGLTVTQNNVASEENWEAVS